MAKETPTLTGTPDPELLGFAAVNDEHIEEFALTLFADRTAKGDEVGLTAILVGRHTHTGQLMVSQVSRGEGVSDREFAEQLRALVTEFGAVWVAVLSEMWAAPFVATDLRRPSLREDRAEIYTLLVQGPFGTRNIVWEILPGRVLGEKKVVDEAPELFKGIVPTPVTN